MYLAVCAIKNKVCLYFAVLLIIAITIDFIEPD